MRLLHAKTFKLHSFYGRDIPSYAILSHRWSDPEVVFQDLESVNGVEIARTNVKISGCCAQAARDGYEYVWIDSCCIDKSSSAELSEAINSMFRWYKDAIICYVYMSDVYFSESNPVPNKQSFKSSAWFTRGWTLQELLAPDMIVFYDKSWNEIGTKATLKSIIEETTRITHLFDFSKACIAQKMSWAAMRTTTRVEDEAYCLMGLFGINMPILYGEGMNAFLRLQQEIIKQSDDESIFAWTSSRWSSSSGMLAESPSDFRDGGEVVLMDLKGAPVFPFETTNKGLRIRLQLIPIENPWLYRSGAKQEFFASLRCQWKLNKDPIAIKLRAHMDSPDMFVRIFNDRLYTKPEALDESTRIIYITTPQKSDHEWWMDSNCWFHVVAKDLSDLGYRSKCIRGDRIPSLTSRKLAQNPSLEVKSQEGVAWVIFRKFDSDIFLGMTFENGRPGLQLHHVTDLDDQSALPQPLTGLPMDRTRISLDGELDVSVAVRKVTDSGRDDRPLYQVSITVSKSHDEEG
ncbi:hypothetical protein ONS95_004399 [Cadophora gregata]|uniref:uncharacterized protein n=1 Tax=Cadophora gregata TaxID=51156 RepID=UPI0026DB956D|nr:uncharacterized protein ONS95_004399 [Cadophora gregata]KAK0105206.1 hypothetical protein ONS96_004607 [Cadophora gregata f. sp. sojae]KAK0105887.1 hypothetical protein ONS95_004399 [Cadophora gregata]